MAKFEKSEFKKSNCYIGQPYNVEKFLAHNLFSLPSFSPFALTHFVTFDCEPIMVDCNHFSSHFCHTNKIYNWQQKQL